MGSLYQLYKREESAFDAIVDAVIKDDKIAFAYIAQSEHPHVSGVVPIVLLHPHANFDWFETAARQWSVGHELTYLAGIALKLAHESDRLKNVKKLENLIVHLAQTFTKPAPEITGKIYEAVKSLYLKHARQLDSPLNYQALDYNPFKIDLEKIEAGPYNKMLVEKVFRLQEEISTKNDALARRIEKTIIPLLQYEGALQFVTQEELAEVLNTKPDAKEVISVLRVLKGEDVATIAKDVQRLPRLRNLPTKRVYHPSETGNWDGSWDNAVGTYEGKQ